MTETDLSSKSIEWLSCEFARRYNNTRGDLDELVDELRRRDEAVKAICSAAASCLREFDCATMFNANGSPFSDLRDALAAFKVKP
jgi:hypothetical protein